MLCFRSIMLVRSFTVNKIRGTRHQSLLHAICNLFFVFVAYCHLLELYVKCAALYRIFIAHSFWNTRYGRPRGRQFHLTRSLVALGGWSLVRDRTNRKHCPSHEIWSHTMFTNDYERPLLSHHINVSTKYTNVLSLPICFY